MPTKKTNPKKSSRAHAIKPKLRHKSDAGYLHGYSATEQNRLYHQARFLEDHVFDGVEFSRKAKILEVGSGVGAQTEIIAERFPDSHITCVELAKEQISRAQKHLAPLIKSKRVAINQANAETMPFDDDQFDGAFITWFLEHVPDPVAILAETRRVLKRNAVLHINEVLNSSLFLHPYSPATQRYWLAFNDHQMSLKGDPFLGGKLGNYLLKAGYTNIETKFSYWHLDNRQPKLKNRFVEYWINLLLSGAPELVKSGKVTKSLVQEMTKELSAVRDHDESVLFFGFMKAKAIVL
jgi:ubiquinone/menaquinone biosynthesis C-methylase UbiE